MTNIINIDAESQCFLKKICRILILFYVKVILVSNVVHTTVMETLNSALFLEKNYGGQILSAENRMRSPKQCLLIFPNCALPSIKWKSKKSSTVQARRTR